MKYINTPFEEIIFSMLMYVDKNEVSFLKEYKMKFLIDVLSSRNSSNYDLLDTYDEYYEDIDQKLQENNENFFEELYLDQDERFTCHGILDDDDLSDYDALLN